MKIPENTNYFIYENVNPHNRKTDDCYVRCLTKAFCIDYSVILGALVGISLKTGYAINSKQVIKEFMKQHGKEMLNQPRHADNTKYTGKQFCDMFKTGTYVCYIGGHHITVIIDGKIHDIWNCSGKTIGNYWKVR